MKTKFSRYWESTQTPDSLSNLNPEQIAAVKKMVKAAFHRGITLHTDRADLLDRLAERDIRIAELETQQWEYERNASSIMIQKGTEIQTLLGRLRRHEEFANRVCAGDVGNTILYDKIVSSAENKIQD